MSGAYYEGYPLDQAAADLYHNYISPFGQAVVNSAYNDPLGTAWDAAEAIADGTNFVRQGRNLGRMLVNGRRYFRHGGDEGREGVFPFLKRIWGQARRVVYPGRKLKRAYRFTKYRAQGGYKKRMPPRYRRSFKRGGKFAKRKKSSFKIRGRSIGRKSGRYGFKRRKLGRGGRFKRGKYPYTARWLHKVVAKHTMIYRYLDSHVCAANAATWIGIQPKFNSELLDMQQWLTAGTAAMNTSQYKLAFFGGTTTIRMKNQSQTPMRMTLFKCVPRNDIPEHQPGNVTFPALTGTNPAFIQSCFTDGVGESKMGQATSAPAYSDPGVTLTDSRLFTSHFKVAKVSSQTLAPGQEHVMKDKWTAWKYPRMLTKYFKVNAGADTSYIYRFTKSWNQVMYYCRCEGDIGSGSTSGLGTTVGLVLVEVRKRYKIGACQENSTAVGIFGGSTASVYNAVGNVAVYNQPSAASQV